MSLYAALPKPAKVSNPPQNGRASGRADAVAAGEQHLVRALNTPLLVLYGLGVTIGAGIYVLIGAVGVRAGIYAPSAFLLAALVMAPSACSFAEFAGRLPVSAGEAAYVKAGFGSTALSLLVGLMVVGGGSLTASAVSVGSAGYIRVFVDQNQLVIIALVVLAMGAVAAWGILQSVIFAAIFTLIEVAGLLLIIVAGFVYHPELIAKLPSLVPHTLDPGIWGGVFAAGLLAFFAFVGFEDMVNVVEEVKQPHRTVPRAIFLTLVISTVVYVLVAAVAVLLVPIDDLRESQAPLSLVFERVTGLSSATISAIAIVATLNGVIVQMIMASRVIYGLSRQGSLPAVFGRVSALTHTPLIATGTVVAFILVLALAFDVAALAEMSARVTLSIFGLVCLALLRLKLQGVAAPANAFVVPSWVPLVGFLSCAALLASDFVT
jgi:amino acid transporter